MTSCASAALAVACSVAALLQLTPLSQLRFRLDAVHSQLKSKVGNILAKPTALRINLNIDGAPISARAHTHPSQSQTACLLSTSLPLSLDATFPLVT